jgi:two-component system sensor histidine kinase AdeS
MRWCSRSPSSSCWRNWRAATARVSRAELLASCLPEGDTLERTVDSHVSKLRKKLETSVAGIPVSIRGGLSFPARAETVDAAHEARHRPAGLWRGKGLARQIISSVAILALTIMLMVLLGSYAFYSTMFIFLPSALSAPDSWLPSPAESDRRYHAAGPGNCDLGGHAPGAPHPHAAQFGGHQPAPRGAGRSGRTGGSATTAAG